MPPRKGRLANAGQSTSLKKQSRPRTRHDEQSDSDYSERDGDDDAVEDVGNMPKGEPRRRRSRRGAGSNPTPLASADPEGSEYDDDEMVEETRVQALPPYESKDLTFEVLVRLINEKDLVLNPDYQREFIWNKGRQTNLIQSIFKGYPIPVLIFNERRGPKIGRRYPTQLICIDGRQRLETIHRFTRGSVPGREPNRMTFKWFRDNGDGKKKLLMSTAEQEKFWKQTFTCYIYTGLSEKDERDIFKTINEGAVALKNAELKRSQRGPWQDFAREMEKKYELILDLCIFKRASGFMTLIRTFTQILECRQALENGKKPVLRDKNGLFKRVELCTDENKAILRETFETYRELALHHEMIFKKPAFKNHNFKGTLGFAPVEFIAVAVFIDQHAARELRELAAAITEMRICLRRFNTTLRVNVALWSSAWDYIREYGAIPAELNPPSGPSRPGVGHQQKGADAQQQSNSTRAVKGGSGQSLAHERGSEAESTADPQAPWLQAWSADQERSHAQGRSALSGADTIHLNAAAVSLREAVADARLPPTSTIAESSNGTRQAPTAPMLPRQTPLQSTTSSKQTVRNKETRPLAPSASRVMGAQQDDEDLAIHLKTPGTMKESKDTAASPNKRRAGAPLQDDRDGKQRATDATRDVRS